MSTKDLMRAIFAMAKSETIIQLDADYNAASDVVLPSISSISLDQWLYLRRVQIGFWTARFKELTA